MQSIIKYPGGKRKLVPAYRELFPPKFNHLIEPFVGSASVFLGLEIPGSHAILGDVDWEIAALWQSIRDSPQSVIAWCRNHRDRYKQQGKAYYESVRERHRAIEKAYLESSQMKLPFLQSQPINLIEVAANRIFFAATGFNGLARKANGLFNVPHGDIKSPNICPSDQIEKISRVLAGAEILNGDFEEIAKLARPGDLVYCDPPYFGGFTGYDRPWRDHDRRRLRDVARRLGVRGVDVAIADRDCTETRELYGFGGYSIPSNLNTLNCDPSKRGSTGSELLLFNQAPLSKIALYRATERTKTTA